MTHDLIAALLGLAAGVVSAVFGVGGGLIFVPTLIFLGKDSHVAVATSLAAMVPVILMGSWRQTRYGTVRWRDSVVIGLASESEAEILGMTEPKIEFASAIDDRSKLRAAMGVTSIPYALLLDPKGLVRYQGHPGALSERSLQGILAKKAE